jgi:CO dehydrogenase maturation factor
MTKFNIAITGKGGTGKSVITTLIAKVLSEHYNYKILLVDADPTHPHLSYLVDLHPTKTLESIRKNIIMTSKDQNININTIAENIDYKLYESIAENKKFSLLSIGQPEDEGCFCPANTLLKKVISSISLDFDIVLIDCEAGLEQISRNVIQNIDIILIISDLSIRSIETAYSIKKMAEKFTNYKKVGLVLNKAKPNLSPIFLDKINNLQIDILGEIPEDRTIWEMDLNGIPLINIPNNSNSLMEIAALVKKLHKLK